MRLRLVYQFGFCLWLCVPAALALDFCLPTANDAILRPGKEADFYQPTVEGTVESGMFGCVRRGGAKFHEGLDIKCLQRDRRGESTDPVHAVSDGAVAFVNEKPGLSNYGRYVVLEHQWDGVRVYTLYAHLRDVANGIVAGQPVRKGQVIATMGRSTNTREGITPDRAHLHFEINFMLNPSFHVWYAKRDPKAPPFGNFNGRNFFGINAADLIREYAANRDLNFAQYMAKRPVAFTVLVGAKPFPWLTMYPHQVQKRESQELPVAYEVAVTGWGVPIGVWARGASEISESQRRTLARGRAVVHRVNTAELERTACRGLVRQSGRDWVLTPAGEDWAELLTFTR